MTQSEIARNLHSMLKVLHPELKHPNIDGNVFNLNELTSVSMIYPNFEIYIFSDTYMLYAEMIGYYKHSKHIGFILDLIEENDLC